jgi:hypothetical protein
MVPSPEESRALADILADALTPKPNKRSSEDEVRLWLAWWQPSLEMARDMTPEAIEFLRALRWGPPMTASQICSLALPIVRRSRRPNIYSHPGAAS